MEARFDLGLGPCTIQASLERFLLGPPRRDEVKATTGRSQEERELFER